MMCIDAFLPTQRWVLFKSLSPMLRFFCVARNFDLWTEFCSGIAEWFVSRYCSLYGSFLLDRRQSYETHYVDINRSNRLARAQQGVFASVTTSSEVSGSVKANVRANVLGSLRCQVPIRKLQQVLAPRRRVKRNRKGERK